MKTKAAPSPATIVSTSSALIIPFPSVVGTPDASRVGGASIAPSRAAGPVLILIPDFSEPLEVFL